VKHTATKSAPVSKNHSTVRSHNGSTILLLRKFAFGEEKENNPYILKKKERKRNNPYPLSTCIVLSAADVHVPAM
jgi:hypothetical protein